MFASFRAFIYRHFPDSNQRLTLKGFLTTKIVFWKLVALKYAATAFPTFGAFLMKSSLIASILAFVPFFSQEFSHLQQQLASTISDKTALIQQLSRIEEENENFAVQGAECIVGTLCTEMKCNDGTCGGSCHSRTSSDDQSCNGSTINDCTSRFDQSGQNCQRNPSGGMCNFCPNQKSCGDACSQDNECPVGVSCSTLGGSCKGGTYQGPNGTTLSCSNLTSPSNCTVSPCYWEQSNNKVCACGSSCVPLYNQSCDGSDADSCKDGVRSCDGNVCSDDSTTKAEVCDRRGGDEDCDGKADCDDSDCAAHTSCIVIGPLEEYCDGDGDGYVVKYVGPNPGNCRELRSGETLDCDDTTNTKSPGNTEAACDGDLIDNDCKNGDAPDCTLPSFYDHFTCNSSIGRGSRTNRTTDACTSNSNPPAYNSNQTYGDGTSVCISAGTTPSAASCPKVDICSNDTTPPVISACPANISLTTAGTTAIATWNTPIATDTCSTPTVRGTHNSGTPFQIGNTTVTYTATDAKNNSSTCSFTVTVKTSTLPTMYTKYMCIGEGQWTNGASYDTPPSDAPLYNPNTTYYHNQNGNLVYLKDPEKPSASNCKTYQTPTQYRCDIDSDGLYGCQPSATPGTPIPGGGGSCRPTNPIPGGDCGANNNGYDCDDYTKDPNNKTPTCPGNQCSNDTTPPVFVTNCPANISQSTTADSTPVSRTEPTATDVCSPPTTVTRISGAPSGSYFQAGTTTTIKYQASDTKGNKTSCQFDITITKTINPSRYQRRVVANVGSCSASCGGGKQQRLVQCIDTESTIVNKTVDASLCAGQTPPPEYIDCNTDPCKRAGVCGTSFGTCSFGVTGSLSKNTCGADSTWTCQGDVTTNPTSCNLKNPACTTYSWYAGPFGTCSKSCGTGEQTRIVECRDTSGNKVADNLCSGEKPKISQSCNTQTCPIDAVCGKSYGQCEVGSFQTGTDLVCGATPDTRGCNSTNGGKNVSCKADNPACPTDSFNRQVGDYGACSVSCGGGTQTRPVFCKDSKNTTVDESKCDPKTKPTTTNTCNTQSCGGGGGGGNGGYNPGGGNNYCGDGLKRSTEDCDDGNNKDGDGCDSNCHTEYPKKPGIPAPNPNRLIVDAIKTMLDRMRVQCAYDDYDYPAILKKYKDVKADDIKDPAVVLTTFCITKGYKRKGILGFNVNSYSSIYETIKIITKIHALSEGFEFDEKHPDIVRVPYRDVRQGRFTDYVNYAHEMGLLDGIAKGKELKGQTPISVSQVERMLNNIGLDTSLYRIFKKNGSNKVNRDDLSALMVKIFENKFAYAEYMMGENMQFYQLILQKLQGKSAAEQELYMRNLIDTMRTWDGYKIQEGLRVHVEGALKFFDAVIGMR